MLEVQMVAVAKLEASYYVEAVKLEAVKLEAEQLALVDLEDQVDQAAQESDHLVDLPVVHMKV